MTEIDYNYAPTPISKLPPVPALHPDTIIPGLQDGITIGITVANLLSAFGGGYSLTTWAPHTHYGIGRNVVEGNNVYTCGVEHTSGPVFDADFDAGYWTVLWDLAQVLADAQAAAAAAAASAAQADAAADQAEAEAASAVSAAGAASVSAVAADGAADEAGAAAAAAANSYDSFDDRYLGPKAADPTLDNDGNALLTGALYWNTPGAKMRVWNGAAWVDQAGAVGAPVSSVFTRTGAVVAAAGDYNASQIGNTPAGTITQTGVQGALNELDTKKLAKAGTTTNDEAGAGNIGQYVVGTQPFGTAVPLTTATPLNVIFIDLSAGDWEVDGQIAFDPDATTSVTLIAGGISTAANTLPAFAVDNAARFTETYPARVPGTTIFGFPTGTARLLLAVPTRVYLVAQASFTVSTLTAYGYLRARRAR